MKPKPIAFNPISWALAACLGVRLAACWNISIINPDGALYIHQAKAVYHGQWDAVFCGLTFLSNYPLMIAAVYGLVHDWIVSARIVSLTFGFAALIPLYYLVKRFVDPTICMLVTLMFGMTPIFVSSSVDAIRDPVCWFFLLLGLNFFVRSNNYSHLIWTSLSFLMAAWARIEAVIFILISMLTLLLIKQPNKFLKLLIITIPLLMIGMISVCNLNLDHIPIDSFYRIKEIPDRIFSILIQYRDIRTKLLEISDQFQNETIHYFIGEARNTVWLIALGTLLNRCQEAFFLPFFLVCLVGIAAARKNMNGSDWIYFSLLSGCSLVLLYIQIITTWVIEYRHTGIVIISCAVFSGFGLEKIVTFLQTNWLWKRPIAVAVIALLIVVFPLYKNLKTGDADKLVFKEIGEFIAQREGNRERLSVIAPCNIQRWISFYANLNYNGAVCPQFSDNCRDMSAMDCHTFVQYLNDQHIRYVVWTEKQGNEKEIHFNEINNSPDFKAIHQWSHQDTGKIVLFEVL